MQRHRMIWRPLVAGCLILTACGCTRTPAGDPEVSHTSDNEAPVIVADAKTNCRFQVVGADYVESLHDSWVRPAWDGACVDGWAEGPGVVRVGLGVSKGPSHDGRQKLGLVDPPWVVTHGSFHHGLVEGAVLIEIPLGVNVFAWFAHGIKASKPPPAVQYVDGFGPWETYSDRADHDGNGWNYPPLTGFAKVLLGVTQHADFSRDAALLDFTKYPTPAVMRSAIAAAHPVRSNATDLLEFLRLASFHRVTAVLVADTADISCRHSPNSLLGALLAETYTICTVTRHINVGHGNTDRWVAQFVFAQNGSIIGIAADRFFDGSNFLARKTALRAEDFFDPNSFKKAALQTLGGQVTRQAVTNLMKSAGLIPAAGAGPGRVPLPADSADITLAFVRSDLSEPDQQTFGIDNHQIAVLESGCNLEFGLVWDFNRQDGRFVNVEAVYGVGCL